MDIRYINELEDVLDEEARVYTDILKISKEKTDIIVAGKVTELDKTVKLEQALVLKVSGLEVKREQLMEKLSVQLGIKLSDITISELIKHVNAEYSDSLKNLQEKLTDLVKELKKINELNSSLIKNSLDFINFSINLFTSADGVNNSYGNSGQVQDSKKRSLFDMKL